MRDAFTNCQDSFAVHPKLIKRLKTYYEKNDPDRWAEWALTITFQVIDSYLAYVGLLHRFFESFMYYLKYPISGYVERSVCFLSTITTTT